MNATIFVGLPTWALISPRLQYSALQLNEFRTEKKLADNVVSTGKNDKLYKAENLGSGTFAISKPKRKDIKVRQTKLKNVKRGSRKG
jgi:hypothetical protein